jgi:hypothetical protein
MFGFGKAAPARPVVLLAGVPDPVCASAAVRLQLWGSETCHQCSFGAVLAFLALLPPLSPCFSPAGSGAVGGAIGERDFGVQPLEDAKACRRCCPGLLYGCLRGTIQCVRVCHRKELGNRTSLLLHLSDELVSPRASGMLTVSECEGS